MGSRTAAFLLRLALSILLAGRATAPAGAESVLRRGNGAEPTTLDPHRTDERIVSNILRDLFEGLVTTDAEGRIIPGAAESWEIAGDDKVYTFHLRPGARWSNGDPITAEDFVYSFRRALTIDKGIDSGANIAIISHAAEVMAGKLPPTELDVEAVSPTILRITLRSPAPYFLALLAADNRALPVHRATVEKLGDAWIQPGNLVSNGPFMLAEWAPRERLSVVRNPQFHDAAEVALDRVIFYPIANSDREMELFKAGKLDVTFEVPQEQVKWISLSQPREFWNRPYIATYYYAFNLTTEPFRGNLKLRQALSMAINREALVSKVTRAGETPAFGLVPPGIAGYRHQTLEFAGTPYEKRVEMARRLFSEAGYGPSAPLHLEILYNTSENNRMIAAAVVAMWEEVFDAGITVSTISTDRIDYLKRRSQRAFQVVRAAWIGDYPDPTVFLNLMLSTARPPRNDPGYREPKYDELIAKAAETSDTAARANLLQQAEKLMIEEMPIIPLYHYATKSLISRRVHGWQYNIRDVHPSRFLSLDP